MSMSDRHSQPLPATRDNAAPRLRARRYSALGIGLSLLIHALLFYLALRHHNKPEDTAGPAAQGRLVLLLNLPPPSRPAPPAAAARPRRSATARRNNVPAVSAPDLPPPNQPPPTLPPMQTAAAEPAAAPEPDMMSMINAARERRRAAEEAAARENAAAQAAERAPSANEIALANVQRSLRAQPRGRDGASGVFQILNKGVRTAQFSFRGWTTDARNNWREVIEVDAGLQGDVERAIVRKMIELIRKHYAGDFNWESQRLGRIVVLSARITDNAGLESFLLREFFDGAG